MARLETGFRSDQAPVVDLEYPEANLRISSFPLMQNVPQNLHRIQGVNHLNKVLQYAPFVEEEGHATVHLTSEDWHVVLDTLFHMATPKDELPESIQEFELTNDDRTIQLKTSEMTIDVEQI